MRSRILVMLGAAALLAVGCEKGASNAPTVQAYEQKRAELMKQREKGGAGKAVARKAPAKPNEAAADGGGLVSGVEAYTYDATQKRDPFRSFVVDEASRRAEHERGPLEQFDLSQITVVAVVWGTDRPRALVTDPSGRGYVVQEGTPIGKNDGQVIRIGDNSLLVKETYVDYLGEATTKEIEMRIRSKSQGG